VGVALYAREHPSRISSPYVNISSRPRARPPNKKFPGAKHVKLWLAIDHLVDWALLHPIFFSALVNRQHLNGWKTRSWQCLASEIGHGAFDGRRPNISVQCGLVIRPQNERFDQVLQSAELSDSSTS
jgi:hypothetical protein